MGPEEPTWGYGVPEESFHQQPFKDLEVFAFHQMAFCFHGQPRDTGAMRYRAKMWKPETIAMVTKAGKVGGSPASGNSVNWTLAVLDPSRLPQLCGLKDQAALPVYATHTHTHS